MGIFGALSTAVTGLRAQAFALENISGNIANSQTTGFKRVDTDFIDLIPDFPRRQQVAGSVLASSRSTNTIQGDVKSQTISTFMAINEKGFFLTEPALGQADGLPVFAGANFYTRRGDFEIDKNGFLVNAAGQYLKGMPVDQTTGNLASARPEVVQVSNSLLPAKATTRVNYQLNLPVVPKTQNFLDSNNAPGTEIWAAATPTISATNEPTFLSNSIEGGNIPAYTKNGAPVNIAMRWVKIANSTSSTTTDDWKLYYLEDGAATGGATKWNSFTDTFKFKEGLPDPAIEQIAIGGKKFDGITLQPDVAMRFGTVGLTQFHSAQGAALVTTGNQDGYSAGRFFSVAVNDSGRVVVSYDNGQNVEVAQVAIATFNAPNQLQRLDGGVFAATSDSGEPVIDLSGAVTGAALETSNTDISDEFTKLIVTQQAYAAGTRIVSTADKMLQEALNMVR